MSTARSAQITRLRALPGEGDEMLAVLQGFLAASNTEPDTLVYMIHRDERESDVFWVYELFSSDQARAEHAGAPEVVQLIANLGPLRAEPSWIHPLAPVTGKVPGSVTLTAQLGD